MKKKPDFWRLAFDIMTDEQWMVFDEVATRAECEPEILDPHGKGE